MAGRAGARRAGWEAEGWVMGGEAIITDDTVWISEFMEDGIPPCGTSLDQWAEWIGTIPAVSGDEVFGDDIYVARREAIRAGKRVKVTSVRFAYLELELRDGKLVDQAGQPFAVKADMYAVAYWPGGGWSEDEIAEDLSTLAEMLEFEVGPIWVAVKVSEVHTWMRWEAGPPPRLVEAAGVL